ncbi:hypothetical protein C8J56DRAFT_866429 [Mycena floridula]|nr:hypothetical protein C8J56DRAFT_866429 [Mycena floridula]
MSTHLQLLDRSARDHGSRPMFWVPISSQGTVEEWNIVTTAQFHAQVVSARSYYVAKLSELGIATGSVVGIWLSGNKHTDLVHTTGISAAGYIPQVFSIYYTHPKLVFTLLSKSGAKALFLDSLLVEDFADCPVQHVDVSSVSFEDYPTNKSLSGNTSFELVKEDVVLIVHTSGSTSGTPSLVPWTNRWIASQQASAWSTGPHDTPDVIVRLGNFHHGASLIEYFGYCLSGASIVLPSSLNYSPDEVVNMIRFCGLSKLCQFGPLLQKTLESIRRDPALLPFFQGLREISYGGAALSEEYETWAHENNLKLLNVFASSEAGVLMHSAPGSISSHLKPLPSVSCSFIPYFEAAESQSETSLLELVLEPDSPKLPSVGLDTDGRFYTGDLFALTDNDCYIFKGRKNDWIKCGVGLICDTKAIENAARQFCPDLIIDCVVVGQNRRGPALLVEPSTKDPDLPDTIIGRLASFNESRFPHERVDDPGLVLIVEAGVLPRTEAKGNIRRKAAEEMFSEKLDEMYRAVVAPTSRMLS